MRIGAHEARDVIVVPGLDLSAAARPEVTIEVWFRARRFPASVGRLAGNSLDKHALGGRSISIHDTAYGPLRDQPVPPLTVDASFTAVNGRVSVSSGHLYDSQTPAPAADEWFQYVGVWDRNEVKLYINGLLSDSQPVFADGNAAAPAGSKNFAVGNHEFQHAGGRYRCNGFVGLVRVWGRTLNDDEVTKLWHHSEGRFRD